jgi:hypothetical protein
MGELGVFVLKKRREADVVKRAQDFGFFKVQIADQTICLFTSNILTT